MAYAGKHTLFVHVAKCGGCSLRSAFARSGFAGAEVGTQHCPVFESDLWSWCVVREPCSWFRSFWCYRQRCGHTDIKNMLDKTGSPLVGHDVDLLMDQNFEKWVDNCVTHMPGSLSRYYENMMGWPLMVNQVIGMGNLLSDASELLCHSGEKFDEELFLPTPVVNGGGKWLEKAVLTNSICNKIRKSEDLIYERFGNSLARRWF